MKNKPKILVIEDDPNTIDLHKDMFAQAGFEVAAFTDADGYFADLVAEVNPDIISMDIMIGREGSEVERDGLEAVELLQADLRTKDIPIMILSNFFADEKVLRAKKLGAKDYLNLSGLTAKNIPNCFLAYLKNPEKYTPIHPQFQKRPLIPSRK